MIYRKLIIGENAVKINKLMKKKISDPKAKYIVLHFIGIITVNDKMTVTHHTMVEKC